MKPLTAYQQTPVNAQQTQTCDREREIQQQTNILSALMAALIILLFFLSGAASDLHLQTAHPGENVILKCNAGDASIDVVEWTRDDLESKYVLLVIDGYPHPKEQHPSFKDRVELVDRKMENGDVSLVLKNVRSEDRGIYRCRVETGRSSRTKRAVLDSEPINSIQLEVTDSQKGDPETDDPGNDKPVNEDFPRVAVGLGVAAGVVVCSVGLFLGWKYKRNLDNRSEWSAVV
ncbi:CD276 antigen homolog isoform X3 [Sebastes umbrosus]|uniref:CD276 antigen homolog isoform X3 n=1 Tax=Sebastes umbrosus TaxID=72105 RepID=UPI0018A0E900|nr:CD276 antigen homolog isoform X3 [Sebastes umbrosus]